MELIKKITHLGDDWYVLTYHGGFELTKSGFQEADEFTDCISHYSGNFNDVERIRRLGRHEVMRRHNVHQYNIAKREHKALISGLKFIEANSDEGRDLNSKMEVYEFWIKAFEAWFIDHDFASEVEYVIRISSDYSHWNVNGKLYEFKHQKLPVMKALLEEWCKNQCGLTEYHLLKRILSSPNHRLLDTFRNHQAYADGFIEISKGMVTLKIPEDAKITIS